MNRIKCVTISLLATCLSAQFTLAQEITFFTPTTVRVLKNAPDTSKETGLSLVVTAKPENVNIAKKTVGDVTTYSSSALTVTVNTKTQQVSFADAKGNVLMAEGSMGFTPITTGPDAGRYKVKQAFALAEDEPIYGLGLLQNEKMSQRGEHRLMTQSNLEDFAHFFQSIKGYGVYWDNYSPTQIDDDKEMAWESQVGTKIDYYFMYGGNADGVIKEMRKLTGHVPMLPLWTYGFHQSRERYKTPKELLEVVDTYRQTGVPFDGIIQDWQYWGNNYLWNAMDFLNDDYADNYRQMIDRIHDANAHMSISIWASFGPHTLPFRELQSKGLLYDFETWPSSGLSAWPPNRDYLSGVRCYDPYSKDAREIYWKNLSRLHEAGVDAWWMDSTDPDHINVTDSDLDQVRPISNPADGKDFMGSWRMVRNAFPLCTVEGVYNNQRKTDKSKRVFILTRSYFAGQQRTGANTWSGDISSSWDSFRKQVPICLNYTLTANPNVNTDIGGFFANAYNKTSCDNTATKNPLYQELYVRWMQFGVFCPMMRSHGTEVNRELYHYGKPGEPVYDALLSAVKMRYELMPYIYSLAWQVSENDDSYMRALMMDFKDDKTVWNNNREFMFGRSLLVAPVMNALYTPEVANVTDEMSGWDIRKTSQYIDGFKADWTTPKTYDVYLPKGTDWYDFWTGERLAGGQTISANAPLSHSPLYVKAGSIVPFCKSNPQYTNITDWRELDIMVYPGCDAEFTLYEDEGDNYNYEEGKYSTIVMKWDDKAKTLIIGKRNGEFDGMLTERQFNVRLLGGVTKSIRYNGEVKSVKFEVVDQVKVEAYPIPAGAELNNSFRVTVLQDGIGHASPTYLAQVDRVENARHNVMRTSMTQFSFSGEVEVCVEYLKGDIDSVRIRPLSYSIKPVVKGNTISFKIDKPRNLSIEVNGDIYDNLQLFACSIVPQPTKRERKAKNFMCFDAGIHEIGDSMFIPSNTTVYVAGGAVVKGRFVVQNAENVRIYGRGIIDYKTRMGVTVKNSRNVEVEGLVMTQLPVGGSHNVRIKDVKVISYYGWGDGLNVFASDSVFYSGCFARTSDDCHTVYATRKGFIGNSREIYMENCQLWADVAHPIFIGLHGRPTEVKGTTENDTIEHLRYKDIDILEQCEYQTDYQGCLAIGCGDLNLVRDIEFDDIRIEEIRQGQIFNLRTTWNAKYCSAPGLAIENVTFRNVSYNGKLPNLSILAGYSPEHSIRDIHFYNLRMNGTHIYDKMPGKPGWWKTSDLCNMYTGENVINLTFE